MTGGIVGGVLTLLLPSILTVSRPSLGLVVAVPQAQVMGDFSVHAEAGTTNELA